MASVTGPERRVSARQLADLLLGAGCAAALAVTVGVAAVSIHYAAVLADHAYPRLDLIQGLSALVPMYLGLLAVPLIIAAVIGSAAGLAVGRIAPALVATLVAAAVTFGLGAVVLRLFPFVNYLWVFMAAVTAVGAAAGYRFFSPFRAHGIHPILLVTVRIAGAAALVSGIGILVYTVLGSFATSLWLDLMGAAFRMLLAEPGVFAVPAALGACAGVLAGLGVHRISRNEAFTLAITGAVTFLISGSFGLAGLLNSLRTGTDGTGLAQPSATGLYAGYGIQIGTAALVAVTTATLLRRQLLTMEWAARSR